MLVPQQAFQSPTLSHRWLDRLGRTLNRLERIYVQTLDLVLMIPCVKLGHGIKYCLSDFEVVRVRPEIAHEWRAIRLTRIMTAAVLRKVVADSMVASASFHSRRLRLIQAKKTFDDPSAWLDREADLIGPSFHDFNGDGGCLGHTRASISSIGEHLADKWKWSHRGSQKRSSSVTVLNAGRMRKEYQCPAVRVDECMALAALDLLTRIIAAWTSALAGLDRLTVDDGGGG